MKANTFTAVSDGSEGVTLLEMLVAMVVFATVILSATMLFKNSLYRFSRQSSDKKIYSEATRVYGYIEKYLPSAMCNDLSGPLRINFKGEKNLLRFVSPFSEGPESDLAVFGIYFDEDDSTVKVAVKRVDRASPNFSFPAGFAGAQTLGKGINRFEVSYFNGSEWLDEWDTGQMAEPCLPRMVRLSLTVFSGEKIEGERIEKTFTRFIGIE